MTDVPAASIPCPKCGRKFDVPLREIVPGQSTLCPNCGEKMTFGGQDASKIQRIIDQLGEQIPGARINVTIKTKTPRPWWKFWAR